MHTLSWGERLWLTALRLVQILPGTEHSSTILPEAELYPSAMLTRFNRLHQWIFPRFFQRIQVEGLQTDALQQLPPDAAWVYVTTSIGQLEYNYFNYLYNSQHLPLPQLGNTSSLLFWRSWGDWKRLARLTLDYYQNHDHLPSAVRSGLLRQLVSSGVATFIQLKTSAVYDNLHWEKPEDDPLLAVVQAAKLGTRPVYCIPQDFIWDRHPSREPGPWRLFFLGDEPGPFRRLVRFFLRYKQRAVAKLGEPINVTTFIAEHASVTDPQLAQALRQTLLDRIQREKMSVTGPSIKPKEWLAEQVLHDAHVQRSIYELAQSRGKSVAAIQDLAQQYIKEISADVNYSYVEIVAMVMTWVLNTLYDGIVFDDAELQRVKRTIGKGPLILVPNHRSHMDYLLISTLFYNNNLVVPFVAGGINMAFWPMGTLFRKCGAFFLRRSFGGNTLYKAVFQAYLTQLVREGYTQEFFIEGGRSRTGKMAHPKMGMLSMQIEAWLRQATADIQFVPVSVTYDQVLEVKSYASELSGGQKETEKARDILKLHKFFKRRWGKIYLQFGEPISLQQTAEELWENASPQTITHEQKPLLVQHMSKTILYAINKGSAVTPMSLVAMVLLARNHVGCTFTEITQQTDHLIHYLQWKGVTCSKPLITRPHEALKEALQRLQHNKLVNIHANFSPTCYTIHPGHRIYLDYTKNTSLHFFVSIGCLARILERQPLGQAIPFTELLHQYEELKLLFKYEFNFSTRKLIDDHLRAILHYMVDHNIVTEPTPDHFQVAAAGQAQLHLFASLLDNYFEAYRILFQFIREVPSQTISEKGCLKLLLHYGKHMLFLGTIRHSEAISKSIFQNGIILLKDLELITMTPQGDLHWTPNKSNPLAHIL